MFLSNLMSFLSLFSIFRLKFSWKNAISYYFLCFKAKTKLFDEKQRNGPMFSRGLGHTVLRVLASRPRPWGLCSPSTAELPALCTQKGPSLSPPCAGHLALLTGPVALTHTPLHTRSACSLVIRLCTCLLQLCFCDTCQTKPWAISFHFPECSPGSQCPPHTQVMAVSFRFVPCS